MLIALVVFPSPDLREDIDSSPVATALLDAAPVVLAVLPGEFGDALDEFLQKVDEETWRKAWDLKVFGYINLTRKVYAAMKERRAGVIVNILGAAGERL
ncbi:SDR family NAD(P)-dependent oxidoreductase, partial [bacterium]